MRSAWQTVSVYNIGGSYLSMDGERDGRRPFTPLDGPFCREASPSLTFSRALYFLQQDFSQRLALPLPFLLRRGLRGCENPLVF
jgi:hypothetical protein